FNDTATTEIYTLSLHDALPICVSSLRGAGGHIDGSRDTVVEPVGNIASGAVADEPSHRAALEPHPASANPRQSGALPWSAATGAGLSRGSGRGRAGLAG